MKEDSKTSADQILQIHSGAGDNVGVKHVYHAISPSAIQKPIEEILTRLRHRDVDSADEKLTNIRNASQLDAAAVAILSTVSVLVDLACGNPPENSYSIVENCQRISEDRFVSDIALSALIRLDIFYKRLEDASRRYGAIEAPGEYCLEAFLEFLATADLLEGDFSSNAFSLSEITLCGLTRGLLRCKSYELSISVADILKSKYPSFNSKVVNLIARINRLGNLASPVHYWLISRSEQKNVLELVGETMELMDESNGADKRLINQSIGFLKYLIGSHSGLVDACWRHVTKIEEIDPEMASYLSEVKERSSKPHVGIYSEIEKAERDFSYRKSLIKRLTERSEISQEDLFILSNVAKSEDISQWVNQGGKVITANEIEQKITDIELLCYSDDGSKRSKLAIKNAVDSFLVSHKSKLPQINVHRLLELSKKISHLGLYPQVCALFKPIMPGHDLWVSPIVRSYIVALVNSHQLATLNSIFAEIPQKDWCSFLWEVKARQLEYINDVSGAVDAIKAALELEPDSISLWEYVVHLHKKNGTSNELYADCLQNIPDELFNYPSEPAWKLLYEMSCNGGFYRVENILVSWFVDNPNEHAVNITNFHFAKAASLRMDEFLEPSKETAVCLGGYSFLVDGSSVSKLIVKDIDPSNAVLLRSDSPLGQLLLNMKTGETINHGMQEIKLIEVLPPYVAILRLAADLRQANNDGSDCFYQFSLPDDPEEMIKTVEKKLLASTDESKGLICSNPKIPLFLKGHRFEGNCPVHAALYQYCSPESIKHPLPNLGESQPSQILLDAYAIVYLGLTGLAHGLAERNVSIVITIETKALLDAFLENIYRDDYMRMGIDKESGKLRVTNAEQVQSETKDVQFAIKHVLEMAEIVAPRLVDMPPEVVSIRDSLDASVYSSLALSISNDMPWLCVDPTFAQLSMQLNYPVANALQFFMSLSVSVDFDKKLLGLYRHVSRGLPYPLTFEDILQLSKSEDKHADYFLFKLLEMYPEAYPNTEAAIFHLHKILLVVLIKAFRDGEILQGLIVENPRNNRYTEHVFNMCCQLSMRQSDGREAEQKLAMLLCDVVDHLKAIPSLLSLVRKLASNFVAGHFLSFDAVNAHVRSILSAR